MSACLRRCLAVVLALCLHATSWSATPWVSGFYVGWQAQSYPPSAVDYSRKLGVQFTSTLMPGLPWEIRPLEPAIELHPGELRTTRFLVRNLSDQTIVGQAVPSVSPTVAARSFQKLDCFCFTQQTLAPGESREMALTFVVDSGISKDISELTLAYAFFPAPPKP